MGGELQIVLFLVVMIMAAAATVIGPTGGVVLATLALTLPAPAVVPVHAMLMSGGSLIRFSMLRKLVDYRTLGRFAAGGIVGVAPAALLVSRSQPDPSWIRLGLGAAILTPPLLQGGSGAVARIKRGGIVALGTLTSFLSVFVGATSAVVGSVLLRHYKDQRERVATQAGCSAFQHTAKIAVYAGVGFSFRRYLPVIALLFLATIVGTWLGKYLLVKTSNDALRASFEVVILGLGGYLCVTSGMNLLYRAP